MEYKKGTPWDKPLTSDMKLFESHTFKKAVHNGKITGQFEYWLYQKHKKRDEHLILEQKRREEAYKGLEALRILRKKLALKIKLTDIELSIMEILYNKKKPMSESDIKAQFYIGIKGFVTVKPIREDIKKLVAKEYIKRNDKGRYILTKEGKANIKNLLLEKERRILTEKIRLDKEAIEKDKRTIKEYKEDMPKLKQKSEKAEEEIRKLANLIPREEKLKELCDSNEYKKENPVMWHRIKKKDKLFHEMANANNEWYRKRDAIKRLEDKLKGIIKEEEKPIRTRIDIEIQLEGVLKSLERHPNDRELKKLEKELRIELDKAMQEQIEMNRKNKSFFN